MTTLALRSSSRRVAASFALLVLALQVAVGSAPAAGTQQTVKVWFLLGEQMLAVPRPGASAEDAVRQLVRGPTSAERKRGVETYVPAGTKVRTVTVENGLATVDVSLKFALGKDSASLLARLSQLVHTATGPEGATKVRLLVLRSLLEDGSVDGLARQWLTFDPRKARVLG